MIKFTNLYKQYNTKDGKTVFGLSNINIDLPETGMVVILGKSGSGKSTLLNVLGGVDKCTSGTYTVLDKNTNDFNESKWDHYRNTYVGFIFQNYCLIEEYTVGKNVRLPLEVQSVKSDVNADVLHALSQVGLEGYENRKPNELSGGEQQRVAIARALIKDPKIILADEPTGNLDSGTGASILETLKGLSKDRLVVMVSHDRESAFEYADRVIELKDGGVIADVTVESQGTDSGEIVIESYDNRTIVKVPKGQVLKEEHLTQLNSSIESNKEITISQTKAVTGKKYSTTTPEKIAVYNKNSYSGLEFKKNRLPVNTSLKMGLSGLKRKWIRTTLAVLLLTIAIIFFGLSQYPAEFNFGNSLAKSFKTDEINTAVLNYEPDRDDWYSWGMEATIPFNKVDELAVQYPNVNFIGVYKTYLRLPSSEDYSKSDIFDVDMAGILEFDNWESIEFIDNCSNCQYPKTNEEVIITDLIAKEVYLPVYNEKQKKQNSKFTEITDIRDLVGKKLEFADAGEFTIVGIKDTNYEQYEELRGFDYYNMDFDDKDYWRLSGMYERYNFELENEYGLLYTHKGFYENFIKNYYSRVDIVVYNQNDDYGVSTVYDKVSDSNTTLFDATIFMDNYDADDLLASQGDVVDVIINSWDAKSIIYGYESSKLNADDIIMEVVGEALTNDSPITDAMREDIRTQLTADYLGKEFTIAYEVYKDKGGMYKTYEMDIRIVGIFSEDLTENDDEYLPYGIYMSKDNLLENSPNLLEGYDAIKIDFNDNVKENAKLFNDLRAKDYYFGYFVGSVMDEYEYQTQNLIITLYIITGIFGLFAAILIINTISSTILDRKKEIGTLRALGCRGTDVGKIFMFEALFLFLITTVIAVSATFFIGIFLDNMISESAGLTLYLFSMTPTIALRIVLFAMIFLFGATLFPIRKVVKMRPIVAIKNLK